jgi:hypothetical protein
MHLSLTSTSRRQRAQISIHRNTVDFDVYVDLDGIVSLHLTNPDPNKEITAILKMTPEQLHTLATHLTNCIDRSQSPSPL